MGTNKKVLVVDDEKELGGLVLNYLDLYGYVCKSAESGNQAIKILEEYHPDYVITDVRMPDGGGIELLTHIRSVQNLNDTRVILMSGYTDYSEDEVKKMGAHCLIDKPIDMQTLLKLLKE
ncbi:MAG: response regulator [Halobacteriovoraceae bacterium]|nr:response regulator [Halobacteriovoraceae bacterium]